MNWYRIKNSVEGNTDVYLFDEIGGWGIMADSLVKELRDIKGKITLHINSPGGSIFEGLAIYNAIKGLDVEVIIEGLAASMASVVAMAGKTIKMAKNSMMMIHKPWTGLNGDSDDLRKAADLLDVLEDQLVEIYSSATSLPTTEIKAMIANETWLTSEQCLEKGFCDEIIDTVAVKNTFTPCRFKNKEQYNKYLQMQDNIKEVKNNRETNMEEIFKLLGVSNEADAIAKIKELLKKVQTLEATQDNINKEMIAKTIEMDIQSKKLLPSQKDFATKALTQGADVYNDFLKAIGKTTDVTTSINIQSGKKEDLNYRALLDNPALHCKMLKENPELVAELEKKWRDNGSN